MSLTNEDLQAIGQLMDAKLDERLKPINNEIKSINDRLDTTNDNITSINGQIKSINTRLDILEHKHDRAEKKVNNLRIDVAIAEREIRRDISELRDEMETVIEVLKMHDMIPR